MTKRKWKKLSEEAMDRSRSHYQVVMGDFKAKIGKRQRQQQYIASERGMNGRDGGPVCNFKKPDNIQHFVRRII